MAYLYQLGIRNIFYLKSQDLSRLWVLREFHCCGLQKMGVEVKTINPGKGETYPKIGQTVVIHYIGYLEDGTKIDSSRDRRQPFKFKIGKGQVIKGWDDGVLKMSVGERAILTCTADYGFGSKGYPGVIPKNAKLILDVELISLE